MLPPEQVTPRLRYFSSTECGEWRDCTAAAYTKYIERVRKPQTSDKRCGTLAHAACAAHLRAYCASRSIPYQGETDPLAAIRDTLKREEWVEIKDGRSQEEDAELALHLADRAIGEMKLHTHRFTPIVHEGYAMIERKVVVPFDRAKEPDLAAYYTGGFKGIVDFLALDEEYRGRVALVDFKFQKSIDAADLPLDVQLALYQYALGTVGLWPELAWQYKILAKWEEKPDLLNKPIKGRRISTDRGGLVTEATFLARCKEIGEDPDAEHYASFRRFLSESRKTWACSLGGADRYQALSIWAEALTTARMAARMGLDRDPKAAVRNYRSFPGSACRRCNLHNQCVESHGTGELVTLARASLESPSTPTLTIDLDDLDQ